MSERNTQELVGRLRSMTGSTTAQEAADALEGFARLLNPIWLMMVERNLIGEPVKDEENIFTFSGAGATDFTTVGDFRKLMGDDRVAYKESMKEYEAYCERETNKDQEKDVTACSGSEGCCVPGTTEEGSDDTFGSGRA